jgi:predicted RNase H-like HicB family nuclease
MDTKILNYRVIIEKEKQKGKIVYVACVPTLGISDFGKSVESAVQNIEKAIKLYLDTLVELKKAIPTPDTEDYFITTRKIELTLPAKKLAYC